MDDLVKCFNLNYDVIYNFYQELTEKSHITFPTNFSNFYTCLIKLQCGINPTKSGGGNRYNKSNLRKQIKSTMKYHVGKHLMNGGSLNTFQELKSFVKQLLKSNNKLTARIMQYSDY